MSVKKIKEIESCFVVCKEKIIIFVLLYLHNLAYNLAYIWFELHTKLKYEEPKRIKVLISNIMEQNDKNQC